MRISSLQVSFVLFMMIQLSRCAFAEESESTSLIRCKKHELDALSKFKRSFIHDHMNRLSSWDGDDCCLWLGVTCDEVTGYVVKLNLRGEEINCGSYIEEALVSYGISSALLELKFLSHLDLSLNNFKGSQIPEFLGSIRHLSYLNLSGAGVSGPIPPQLGNLTNLIRLDLSVPLDDGCYNFPYDDLYTESLGWAAGLTKLQSLNMGQCNMSKAHDTFSVLSRLPSLLELSLPECGLENIHLSKTIIMNTSTTFFSTLQHLDLSYNLFEGPFPSILKNIVSLKSLSLSVNSFNGSISLWLKNISRLEFLDLSYNGFTRVEGGMWGIMGNPCNFKYLDLFGNPIVQGDLLRSFMNSSRCAAYDLDVLSLGYCQLNGSLPSWLGQLTQLGHLDLSHNMFQGQIPASLLKLSALKYLDLSHNRLSGLIPDIGSHFSKIEYLDISLNSIQGSVSGIGNLSKLSYLDMGSNNLSLNISYNWQPMFQLQYFGVRSCKINTVFPHWLKNQTQIKGFDLSYTGLLGELPQWLWNMSNIARLSVAGNQLSGSLPQHITCNGCNLEVVDLHDNRLDGSIPYWLGHQIGLEVVDLSGNLFSGAIFEGENSSSLFTRSDFLGVLDLSDNMFSGEIQIKDDYRGDMLQFLSLRGNAFSGHISSQLCHFRHLMMLELAHNRFNGHIPRCLGSLLFSSDLLPYDGLGSVLEIQEVIKGISQKFTGTMKIHSFIDLSSNRLVGTIPEELTNISKLMQLNLSNNHLIGGIPEEIGKLQMLESLDLSNNNLSGTIPQSLSDMPWLSYLNLSNNHLHGPIPTGNHLQTLINPSSCAGNSALCGFPLPNNCTKPDPSTTPTETESSVGEEDDVEDKHKKMWFYLVIMSGVATGFWGVVGTLVLKKSWRHAYFGFVEETGDRIYVSIKVRLNRFEEHKLRLKTKTKYPS